MTAPQHGHPIMGTLGRQGIDQTHYASFKYFGKNCKYFFFFLDACRSPNRKKALRRTCSYASARHCDTLQWFSLLLEMHHKPQVKGKDQTAKLFCWTEDIRIHHVNF